MTLQLYVLSFRFLMSGSRGDGGGGAENHKNIGFLGNTGLDPLKKSQSYQASIQR